MMLIQLIMAMEVIDKANNETILEQPSTISNSTDEMGDEKDMDSVDVYPTDDENDHEELDEEMMEHAEAQFEKEMKRSGMSTMQKQIVRSIAARNGTHSGMEDMLDMDGIPMGMDNGNIIEVVETPDGMEIHELGGSPMIMMDDDDEDEGHFGQPPPEILELMRVTEMMH